MTEGILLAITQGITEFFPVSSSGHLYLLQLLFTADAFNFSFSLYLNLATAFAITMYYFRFIVHTASGVLREMGQLKTPKNIALHLYNPKYPHLQYLTSLIFAVVPVGVIALLIEHEVTLLSVQPYSLSIGFFITSLILLAIARFENKETYKSIEQLPLTAFLFVGFAQSIALLPGISRMATCLIILTLFHLKRQDSLRFCLISVLPLSYASVLHDLKDIHPQLFINESGNFLYFLTTFFVAILTLQLVHRIFPKLNFIYLSLYVLSVSFLALYLV